MSNWKYHMTKEEREEARLLDHVEECSRTKWSDRFPRSTWGRIIFAVVIVSIIAYGVVATYLQVKYG